uniref:Uncharacterized protein n=1 Tax=Ochrobactrum phage ORM_20 TaxID=2985243 RepID=A0A9N6ZGD2_9VIRU|nr:hypothetical protein ORM20_00227 [Ochrobactrum phage ORM_20]
MLTYYDYYRALMFGLGNAVASGIILISLAVLITSISRKIRARSRKKFFDNGPIAKLAEAAEGEAIDKRIADLEKQIEKRDATAKKINSLKQRIFEDQVIQTDVVDITVNAGYEDEFGEMVDRISDEYTQRQARSFLSCALNLMAHSYGSLEEVRKVATEMIETELDGY